MRQLVIKSLQKGQREYHNNDGFFDGNAVLTHISGQETTTVEGRSTKAMKLQTPVLNVNESDTFYLECYQNTVTTLHALNKSLNKSPYFPDDTYFQIDPIEPTFRGALVLMPKPRYHGDGQPIPNNVHTALEWKRYLYNDGFFSSASETNLIIPPGINKVRLIGSVVISPSNDRIRRLVIRKNGVEVVAKEIYSNARTTTDLQVRSDPLDVNQGDKFDLAVQQNSGSQLTVWRSTGTWFGIEAL
jgi:hypothetical protein